MAFKKRTWIDRLVEFPGRRKLKNIVDGQSATYDVERAEGIVSAEGDDFAAEDMNDLEQRIADGISAVEKAIPKSLPANGGTAEKVSHALKFSGASTETYDGSANKTVNIPKNTDTWRQNTATSEGYVLAGGTAHANQVWKCDGSGVPGWRTDANTTYSAFTKSTTSAAGKAGLVPVPPATPATTHYLREDGTWAIPQNTAALTAGRALVSDSAGKVGVSAVTSTELGYLDGVTSNLQAQINKLSETIDTLNSNLGDYRIAQKNNIPVSVGQEYELVSLTLPSGVWIVCANVYNDTDRLCAVQIQDFSGGLTATLHQATFSIPITLSTEKDVKLMYCCWNSDVSTVPIAQITAVRIK